MGHSPVLQASEEYALVIYQLRVGESLCRAEAAHGRGVSDVEPEACQGPSDDRETILIGGTPPLHGVHLCDCEGYILHLLHSQIRRPPKST